MPTQALVLTYPEFVGDAVEFILQTDASAVGLGALLEQDGHIITYASHFLPVLECPSSSVCPQTVPSLFT